MAGRDKISIVGYQFEVRPKSMWRRIFHDFVPYWQSWKPSFEVIITRKKEDADGRELQWFMRFSNNTVGRKLIQIPYLKRGGKVILTLEGMFLGTTGDALIVLDSNLNILPEDSFPDMFETIYSFHVTQKSWLVLALMAGAVAGLLTIICQYLIGLVDC